MEYFIHIKHDVMYYHENKWLDKHPKSVLQIYDKIPQGLGESASRAGRPERANLDMNNAEKQHFDRYRV